MNKLLKNRLLHVEKTILAANTVICRNASIKYYKNPVEEYSSRSVQSQQRLYAWGCAGHGGLGEVKIRSKTKKYPYIHRPVRKTITFDYKIVDVACGLGFTLFAVKGDLERKLFGCGLNTDSQIGYHAPRQGHALGAIYSITPIKMPLKTPKKTNLTRVAAGRAHSVIVTDTEGVFTCGNNSFGQCGRGIVEDEDYTVFRPMYNLYIPNEKIIDAICGQDHSLLLSESGKVFSFGCGADGQTGLGHYKSTGKPSLVKGDIEGEKIVKVASSADTVLALNDKGEVFGWGNSEYMQIPNSSEQQICTPVHLEALSKLGKIRDIASSSTCSVVLTENREVFVWGFGILGKGPECSMAAYPEQIPETLFGKNPYQTDTQVDSVYCGPFTMAAVTNKGELYTWGKNRYGQLGLGHTESQYFPLRVAVGGLVKRVMYGFDHTMAFSLPYI